MESVPKSLIKNVNKDKRKYKKETKKHKVNNNW